MHAYKAMTVCADESIFVGFYPPELKLFYDRLALEENETYYVTSRSPKHKRMGFPTSQPPPGYRISHTSSQPQFVQRIPYPPPAPSVPFPHKFASDADLAEWRTPSPAANSDANRSPVNPPPPPQPKFALVTNSTTPSNKNHKNKKKKKKAPFSALAELDGNNEQEPLVQEEESNEEHKPTQKAEPEEAEEDSTQDQEQRPTPKRELSPDV